MNTKIVSLLMIIFLIPVVVICQCCPVFAQTNNESRIEKPACHSCCPNPEIVRESTAIEKYTAHFSDESGLIALTAAQKQPLQMVETKENPAVLNQPPPLNLISFSTILRI